MAFFKKRNFYSHRPERPFRASSPKGPMGSKTAIFEMKPLTAYWRAGVKMAYFNKRRFCPHRPVRPLTALLSGGSQNGIFQQTPFLLPQASQAVKSLIAKRADGVQNGHFGNEALNGLTGRRESKWHFSKNADFVLTGQ